MCTRKSGDAINRTCLAILEQLEKKQNEEKPILFIINTSGGGNRSATFTMNVLQTPG